MELANWSRSILVNADIDDDLIRRLTPEILRLRQESNDPITVGIDSNGGSLQSMDVLLGLLKGPDQNRQAPKIIMVVTNKAYSAAANMLAFGDYAVAYKHSTILFHDVRYDGLRDVTPDKAQASAKALKNSNHRHALRLAERCVARLMWNYMDLAANFVTDREKYPKAAKRYQEFLKDHIANSPDHPIKIHDFAVALFRATSSGSDQLIEQTMKRLGRWVEFNDMELAIPRNRLPKSRNAGLLDGPNLLFRHLHKKRSGGSRLDESLALPEDFQNEISAFISIAVSRVAEGKRQDISFNEILDEVFRDYEMIQSMNSMQQFRLISDFMIEHDFAFFGASFSKLTEEERDKAVQQAFPSARLFWYFCVLLCRCLFEGDHMLSPSDAQLLGIIDEVAGGGPVESLREFQLRKETNPSKG